MGPNAGLLKLMNERIIENIMQLYFDDDYRFGADFMYTLTENEQKFTTYLEGSQVKKIIDKYKIFRGLQDRLN